MKVQTFLCDAAVVRENLLHVLGAGITRIWRNDFPTPLNVDLAMLLTVRPSEAADTHRLKVIVQSADGEQLANVDAEFHLQPENTPTLHAGESLVFPLAIPLRAVVAPESGVYSVEVLVDGLQIDSLHFYVEPPPEIST